MTGKPSKPHYAGTRHVPPKQGTRGFIRVVQRGCGGTQDYWGDYDCSHAYTWTCDDCPIVRERNDGPPDDGEPITLE